jgi:hypothetical protein
MKSFPNSAHDIETLAHKLVKFLQDKVENTETRTEWSKQNFRLLQEFSKDYEAVCFPDKEAGEKEFLWDFVGYIQGRGLLLAVESEWDKKISELKKDFEKLLYVRSPLKLMLCRMKTEADAEEIRSQLQAFAEDTCKEYSPAEVFIIYCVWWAKDEGESRDNRDFAYMLQINGKPVHRPILNERFRLIPRE